MRHYLFYGCIVKKKIRKLAEALKLQSFFIIESRIKFLGTQSAHGGGCRGAGCFLLLHDYLTNFEVIVILFAQLSPLLPHVHSGRRAEGRLFSGPQSSLG